MRILFAFRSGKLLSRYYNITYWPIWYIGEVHILYYGFFCVYVIL